MKRYFTVAFMIAALVVGCQREEQAQVAYGMLSVNADVADVPVKGVTVEDMNVRIVGENFEASYRYSELPEFIRVPVDSEIPYIVSAENVTISQAETLPDEWGQKRYAGSTEVLVNKMHDPNETVTNYYEVNVDCFVANSMISVTFADEIDTYFTDYKVTTYTDDARKLVFTKDNAAEAVAHFTAGKTLKYEFSGEYVLEGSEGSVPRTMLLESAQHVTLHFKMKNVEGELEKPVIDVDVTCEDVYEEMTVDPSENGSFIN